MTYFDALVYGAVQGIAEYLPISSSAHLILLPKVLHHQDPGLAFNVFLHVGTLMATVFYFWREWLAVLGIGPVRYRLDSVSWKMLVAATIPALFAGALLHSWAETVFRNNIVLVVTLSVGGIALYLSDRMMSRQRKLEEGRLRDAIWVGVAQCFALIPGISRSGATMTGARLLGFERSDSARFSFLMSAPVTAAATVFELRKFPAILDAGVEWGPLLVAGFGSFLFGCLAIGGLLRLLNRFGYLSFAVYRVVLALIILIYGIPGVFLG